jgi:hypothetical protein
MAEKLATRIVRVETKVWPLGSQHDSASTFIAIEGLKFLIERRPIQIDARGDIGSSVSSMVVQCATNGLLIWGI